MRRVMALLLGFFLAGWAGGVGAAPQGLVVIAQGVDPTTLDPHLHLETPALNVLLQIYDTLLFRDATLKLVPWLAESWRVVNPTTWEFRLRKGAKFHNGEDVDAEAVKYSLERIIDPNTKPQRQITFFNLVDHVEVVEGQRAVVGRGAQGQDPDLPPDPRARGPGGGASGRGGRHCGEHPAASVARYRQAPAALHHQGAERADALHPHLHPQVRHGPQAGGPGRASHEGQAKR